MDFVISILLKLALPVVKDVFRDVNRVKCNKKLDDSMLHFSQMTHLSPPSKSKGKNVNAYFQHLLFYKSIKRLEHQQ